MIQVNFSLLWLIGAMAPLAWKRPNMVSESAPTLLGILAAWRGSAKRQRRQP